MRKRIITYLVFFTGIALAGVITTQIMWFNKAVLIRDDNFNHRLITALQNTRNILSSTDKSEYSLCSLLIENSGQEIEEFNLYIDNIIKNEFERAGINRDFRYAILNPTNNHLLAGHYSGYEDRLINSSLSLIINCEKSGSVYSLVVYLADSHHDFAELINIFVISNIVFVLILFFVFIVVLKSIVKQKKLSDIKTDFLNNMTHEFKTPIATISIASEMMMQPHIYNDEDKARKYAKIIFDENLRMMSQVEQIMQIALLDKGEYKLKPTDVNLHEIIRSCVRSSELTVSQKAGVIKTKLEAINDHIVADENHISNVIINLIDNANKYNTGSPVIEVSTSNTTDGVLISVEDNGMGISKENQAHIFKKFFRASTGNIHDVKGFGLGLYYSKRIVDGHGGHISLFSEPGRGSRFEVFLPFINNLN